MDIQDLDKIAVNVVESLHGDFLKQLARTWLHADPFNKEILREAWETIIKKYKLDKEFLT